MKVMLRVMLALLVVVSVATRLHAVRKRDAVVGGFDVGAAIKSAIVARGYTLLPNPVLPPKVLSSVVYFAEPGCAAPSLVVPFGINNEVRPLLDRAAGAGYTYRILLFDGVWSEQSRVALYVQWLKHAAMSTAGVSPYQPVKTALALARSAGCASDTIDWRQVWRFGPAGSDGRSNDNARHEPASPHGLHARS